MVISFVLSLRLVGSFFSDKKRSLLKGNKGVRRHKGCLSTPHRADKREKISTWANYNRGDERDRARQKRKKIPLFSHLRGGAEVNSLPRNSILHTETREDEEAINWLNIWKASHSRMKVPRRTFRSRSFKPPFVRNSDALETNRDWKWRGEGTFPFL